MVMDRCHFEYTLAVSEFEICYLNNVRRALNNIDDAAEQENYRAVERICGCDNHSSEEHRARVPHKDLGGIVVPEEETYASADEQARHERHAEKFMHIGNSAERHAACYRDT